MSTINVTATAKVNLVLEVLDHGTDGYHEISTILQEVAEPFDVIELKRSNKSSLKCNLKDIPLDETNSILKVINILRQSFGFKLNYQVSLTKGIPTLSGLGGSASDAAAVLKAIDADLGLELSKSQKLDILKQIGSDAAFFLEGGIQLGTGRGDKLSSLPSLPPCRIKVIETGVKISTLEAYQKLDLPFPRTPIQTYKVVEGIRELDIDKVVENLHNDFEEQALREHPKIGQALEKAKADGALRSMLTGSGGAVFAIY
ncbi:MAG: 4-(cytidine 5'-diphospho)-2-C-methyl-D-erythritol kinase [Candidatus Gracilibacteria bacterium]|nr:4-(cytidine 5'-diphospho)-2-C-methyl-D-erythritol kinase [Candidatus Gracilibacteria bacterium]